MTITILTAVIQMIQVPKYNHTDNSKAVTHDLRTGKREFKEEKHRVFHGSTLRFLHNTYTVSSRLTGKSMNGRIFEDRIEGFYCNKHQLIVELIIGRYKSIINYRYIFWSLVNKSGGFSCYRDREEQLPSLVLRKLTTCCVIDLAGLDYLRILGCGSEPSRFQDHTREHARLEGDSFARTGQEKRSTAEGRGSQIWAR